MHRVHRLPDLVAQQLHREAPLAAVEVAAMDEQPRRLVDRDHLFVAMEDDKRIAHAVSRSSAASQTSACSRVAPHISGAGLRPPQNAGRSGRPKIAQSFASVRFAQRTPAGLPCGMPGRGLLIDGAMQQAPQPRRQSKAYLPASFLRRSLPTPVLTNRVV